MTVSNRNTVVWVIRMRYQLLCVLDMKIYPSRFPVPALRYNNWESKEVLLQDVNANNNNNNVMYVILREVYVVWVSQSWWRNTYWNCSEMCDLCIYYVCMYACWYCTVPLLVWKCWTDRMLCRILRNICSNIRPVICNRTLFDVPTIASHMWLLVSLIESWKKMNIIQYIMFSM